MFFFVCGPSGTSQLPEKRIRPNAQIPVMFMQSTTKVGNKEFLTFMMVRRWKLPRVCLCVVIVKNVLCADETQPHFTELWPELL